MPRITLTRHRDRKPGEILFECTREDFFKWLFCNNVQFIDVETDGHILFVIYGRAEADEYIKTMLNPNKKLTMDYRKLMVASEAWKSLLQLLSDYKNNR